MTTVRVIPVPFRVLSRKKNMARTSFVLELVPLGGENEFEPHPQNEIRVPFRGSFPKFRRLPPSLLYGSPPGVVPKGAVCVENFHWRILFLGSSFKSRGKWLIISFVFTSCMATLSIGFLNSRRVSCHQKVIIFKQLCIYFISK